MPDYAGQLSQFLGGLTPPMPAPLVNAGRHSIDAAINAAKLPGDVYAGRVAQGSADYFDRAADLAQFVTGVPGGAGGLGSGARFAERMQAGKDLAQELRNRGRSTGNYGMTGRRTAPDAPKGSFERFAAEQRAGWNSDKDAALDAFRGATGTKPENKMLMAPGESLADLIASF